MKKRTRQSKEKKQPWPQIRPATHKNGTAAWMVDGRIKGKGERFFFKTRTEADTKATLLRTQRKNSGSAGFNIPDDLRVMAASCAERLLPFGKSITDACDFYIVHLERLGTGKTVADILPDVLTYKTAEVKPATLRPYRTRAKQFAAKFGERKVALITEGEITDWLNTAYPDRVTRGNTRRVVVNFFNVAIANGHAAENPARLKLKQRKEQSEEIGILAPEQVAALITHAHESILPYFCIAAFAGVRPEELQRLEWSDVRWKQGVIRIRAAVSKVGVERNVDIEPNLAKWLEDYRHNKGRICPPAWRDLFRETRTKAGITEWPHDCLRHSYASYWLQRTADMPKLSMQMGNSVGVIARHYHKILHDPADAVKFWSIEPAVEGGGKVVQMAEAA